MNYDAAIHEAIQKRELDRDGWWTECLAVGSESGAIYCPAPVKRGRFQSGSAGATPALDMYAVLPRSGDVEAVQVHDFVPGRDEVAYKLLLRIVLRIDFGQGAQL